MNQQIKEEKVKEKNKVYKQKVNRHLLIFLIVFIVGYGFFFSSKAWMPSDEKKIIPTEMMVDLKANNRVIRPIEIEYSEADESIRFYFEMNKVSTDAIDEYRYSMATNDGVHQGMIAYHNESLYVIDFDNVDDFEEISIRIDSKNKKDKDSFPTIKIYQFKEGLKDVKTISELKGEAYDIVATEYKIDGFEREIESIEGDIEKENDIIEEGNESIEALRKDEEYKTLEEINEMKEEIQTIEADIQSAQGRIDDKNKEIAELQERIQKNKLKLNDLKGADGDEKK